jgi:hypothetical protein
MNNTDNLNVIEDRVLEERVKTMESLLAEHKALCERCSEIERRVAELLTKGLPTDVETRKAHSQHSTRA